MKRFVAYGHDNVGLMHLAFDYAHSIQLKRQRCNSAAQQSRRNQDAERSDPQFSEKTIRQRFSSECVENCVAVQLTHQQRLNHSSLPLEAAVGAVLVL
jgi:hypothetical protein